MTQLTDFMAQAIALAKKAEELGEVPVGAVIVHDNKTIAEGYNQPISDNDPTAHAEIIAIKRAADYFKNYRLPDVELYTTLEPCTMCAGAIIHARIPRVYYGAYDPKAGAAGSVFNILGTDKLNHIVEVTGGMMEDQCVDLIQSFFKRKRIKS
jgi:tRNA(adenine34) deaminase